MPLPSEDTTPPVTKTYFVMEISAAGKPNCSRKRERQKASDVKNPPIDSPRRIAVGFEPVTPQWAMIRVCCLLRNSAQDLQMKKLSLPQGRPDSLANRLGRSAAIALIAALVLSNAACNKNHDNAASKSQNEALPVAESPLAKAAVAGDLDGIKAQIDQGAEINAKDPLGRTPLHMAAFYGRTKTTEYLIANGADVNAKDRIGMTPLHVAVISGGRMEVDVLLEKQADIRATTDSGKTALHLAAATGQPKLSKALIDHGADPLAKDAEGKTPQFYATQNKHPQTATLLQKYTDED